MVPLHVTAAAAAPPGFLVAKQIVSYLRLIKFRYHLSYATVVFGALLFSQAPSIDLARSLLVLYVFFNVFLYGGIYTFNDVADVQSDRLHPSKGRRPLASGEISIRAALIFAPIMIVLGLAGAAWLFDSRMVWTFAGFLATNAVYSLGARNTPVVDLVFNSVTHPLRFVMGVSLTGREVHFYHVAVVFALALGVASLRRIVEMGVSGWSARRTLHCYSRAQLIALQYAAFAGIAAFVARDGPASPGFFIAVIPTYLLIVFGALVSSRTQRLLVLLWTR
jgi:hypothetical protein